MSTAAAKQRHDHLHRKAVRRSKARKLEELQILRRQVPALERKVASLQKQNMAQQQLLASALATLTKEADDKQKIQQLEEQNSILKMALTAAEKHKQVIIDDCTKSS